MSQFTAEALFIGAKAGSSLALCLFLITAFLRARGNDGAIKYVHAAVVVVLFASLAVGAAPVTVENRAFAVKMAGTVFGLVYLAALAALYHATGTRVFDQPAAVLKLPTILGLFLFLATSLYFIPDMAASTLYVSDLGEMAGGGVVVRIAAAVGFCIALAAGYVIARRARIDILRIAAFPQMLLALAMVKLVSGGVRGFAEISLIPSVKSGSMKFVHDAIHQLLVMLQVPDHPVLTVTAWNFISVLFGTTAGLVLSLLVFLLPLAIFLKRHFMAPVDLPKGLDSGAARRSYLRGVRDDRMRKALPIIIFMMFITLTWFVQRGEGITQRYAPKPVRLVAENGRVSIPIQAPGSNLLDGQIHKYQVQGKDVDVRFLIVKKPDGTLVVCLDACDICPPDGYAQTKEHVVCLYCNTPIPIGTVGMQGGCNPIPVMAKVTDKEVRIEMKEIAGKWIEMMIGARKKGARR